MKSQGDLGNRGRYNPHEACDHVFPFVQRRPDWFVIAGPGSGTEAADVWGRWPECRILGLEPSPVAYEVARARWPAGAELVRAALWSEVGTVRLWLPENCLHSTLAGDAARLRCDADDFEDVPATTLDELDREHKFRNGLLWMDIEEAEGPALRGGATVLGGQAAFPTVVLEVHVEQATEYLTLMGGYGYKLEHVYLACPTRFNGVFLK